MIEPSKEISFRLYMRRGRQTGKWWLFVSLDVAEVVSLAMVPNTVANRSVITPPALQQLRAMGLVGADLIAFRTGRREVVLRNVLLAGHSIPDFTVQVREIQALRTAGHQYLVDGYLGIDVMFGMFSSLAIDTRTFRVTVRLK